MCWIFERSMKKGGTSRKDVPLCKRSVVGVDARIDPRGVEDAAPCIGCCRRRGFPLGGSCRPQATDEGKAYGHFPFTGSNRKAAPHPASGGASATFPRGGRRLYRSSRK